MSNNNLTETQIKSIVKSLKKLEPGFMPKEIFYEFSRLIVSVAVDIVVFRKKDNKTEVLLVKRPDDDPYWPGIHHIPGAIVLSTDKSDSLEEAKRRVLNGELKVKQFIAKTKFIDFVFYHAERGTVLSLLHWVKIQSKIEVGKWFNVNKLPKNILKVQIPSIKLALKSFKKQSIMSTPTI